MALFRAEQPGPLDSATDFVLATAGAELNVAIGLSRLGLRVGFISRLGDDTFGRHLTTTLDREKIDRQHVGIDPSCSTGFMLKSRAEDGHDPQIEYFRRHSAASRILPADLPLTYCASARHVHLTGIYAGVSASARAFVLELAAQARRRDQAVSFDPNLRPALWASQTAMVECMNQLAGFATCVLPGLEEGRLLTGRQTPADIADFYLHRGAQQVVVKLGPAGAYFASATERGQVEGLTVPQVVDTVGAGDGFAVGVISGLMEGLSLARSTGRGNAIGARVVTFPGDADGLPTRAELQAMGC